MAFLVGVMLSRTLPVTPSDLDRPLRLRKMSTGVKNSAG
jgi:hypothetical protein